MYIALVNVLNTLTTTISSVAFNPIANAKWASVLAVVTTALAATGAEIGNLKNNIRDIITQDIFCLTPCSMLSMLELKHSNVEDIRNELKDIIVKLYEQEERLRKESVNVTPKSSK
jgi:hypothetical protein